MLNEKALRHKMLDEGCSVTELAKVCEISTSALYARLNGKVCFTVGEITKAVERLHLSPEQRDQIFFAREVS